MDKLSKKPPAGGFFRAILLVSRLPLVPGAEDQRRQHAEHYGSGNAPGGGRQPPGQSAQQSLFATAFATPLARQ